MAGPAAAARIRPGAVGLAQILFQAGLFVPGTRAR